MKTTLCQLASQYIHSALAPWYLKSAAAALCCVPHEVRVVNATVNQTHDAILKILTDGAPEVLGLCCYIWNIETINALLGQLRAALPKCYIVLGGPEVSFCADTFLTQHPEVNGILIGEGERSFAALLDALDCGASLSSVPGLCRRAAGGTVTNSAATPLTELFCPYTPDYFADLGGRIAYIETTRGCPFTCAFCLSGREDRLRCFALEPAFHALEQLAQSGTKTIKFIDRTFNANEPRALTIWKFLVQRNAEGAFLPGICFHFEVAADLFSADCLAFLKTVPRGLFQFEAGLQSFHTETLAAVQRKTDTEHLCQNLRSILAGDNIHLHIDLIAGLPHENLETFADSFDRAFALGAHQLQLGFLKLIYGSALRRDAALYDLAATCNAPYEVTSTRWLTPVDFSVLAFAEQSLGRVYNSGRYVRSLPYLLGLWQDSAFDFFAKFGAACTQLGDFPAADALAQRLFEFACTTMAADARLLRDLLALDILATRRAMRLPDFLKVPDDRLKRVNLALKRGLHPPLIIENTSEKFRSGHIAFCILYSGDKGDLLAVCDYTAKDPIRGDFPVTTVPLSHFLSTGSC